MNYTLMGFELMRKETVRCLVLLTLLLGAFLPPAQGHLGPPLKVLFVVTNHDQLGRTGKPTGLWLPELTHPYYAVKGNGGPGTLNVVFASPKGGKAPIDPHSIDLKDPDNKRFLADAQLKRQLENTIPLSKVNPGDYWGVLFVGGHGPMWDMPDDVNAQRIIRYVYEHKSPVAAVCHGPAALVNAKLSNGKYLVAGKKLTSFSNAEEQQTGYEKVVPFSLETKLKERGAKFEAAPPQKPKVVVDGMLLTGQNPASARELGVEFRKHALMSDQEKAALISSQ